MVFQHRLVQNPPAAALTAATGNCSHVPLVRWQSLQHVLCAKKPQITEKSLPPNLLTVSGVPTNTSGSKLTRALHKRPDMLALIAPPTHRQRTVVELNSEV